MRLGRIRSEGRIITNTGLGFLKEGAALKMTWDGLSDCFIVKSIRKLSIAALKLRAQPFLCCFFSIGEFDAFLVTYGHPPTFHVG